MSQLGQTEKHSARADVFRSSPKNGRWFGTPQNITRIEFYGMSPFAFGRDTANSCTNRRPLPRSHCSARLCGTEVFIEGPVEEPQGRTRRARRTSEDRRHR
jgi:hypothetical protein